jgi:hypothetical protein
MRALQTLRLESHPTITVMATAIAPALSTTLMGLIFAILNLFFFNILKAYFEELHVRFNLAFNDYASKTLLTMAHFLQPEEKEKLRLILDIPSEARIYDDSVLKLIERVRKQAEEDLKLPSPQPPPVAPPQKKSIVKETSSLKKGGGLA